MESNCKPPLLKKTSISHLNIKLPTFPSPNPDTVKALQTKFSNTPSPLKIHPSFSKAEKLSCEKHEDSPFNYRPAFAVKETRIAIKSQSNDGTRKVNEYKILQTLGKGSYAKVKLAINEKTSKKLAIKVFHKSILKHQNRYSKDSSGQANFVNALQDVFKEIAIMKKLSHPNITRLYEVIDDEEGDKLYMILDLAPKGELLIWSQETQSFKISSNLSPNSPFIDEKVIRRIMRDCIKGLNYLHQNGIIHCDLKPQNILLDEDLNAKISDFGVSNVVENNDILVETVGTYHFLSPESLISKKNKSNKTEGYSGKAADIWALGITFYALMFLKLPFYSTNLMKLMEMIEKDKVKLPKKLRIISPNLKNFFKRILDKNPKTRISMEELKTHPWINEGYAISLKDEIELQKKSLIEVSQAEVDDALCPQYDVVFMKAVKILKDKWKNEGCFKESAFSDKKQFLKTSPSCKTMIEKNLGLNKEFSSNSLNNEVFKKKNETMNEKLTKKEGK